jgi:transposase InsO family protein
VAVEYRRLLYINGFRQSMSRKGNCYDNAQAESFFSRFKAELLENGIFESVEDAESEVFSERGRLLQSNQTAFGNRLSKPAGV